MNKEKIIDTLFTKFSDIRYVALYTGNDLVYKQKKQTLDSSAEETDKYEELLVNPVLLKLASQRGNIDCGGLNYLIIKYGNFFQLIRSIREGHISICIKQDANLNSLPNSIFDFLNTEFHLLYPEAQTSQ